MVNTLSFLIILLCCMQSAYAKDFGTYGKTFTIAETDLLEAIRTKLTSHNMSDELAALNASMQRKIAREALHPAPIGGIIKATKDAVRAFDPTTYLEEDIEDEAGHVLFMRGTAINPLQYMRFTEPLVFIDGRDEEQVAFAKKYAVDHAFVKIILVAGEPGLQKDDVMFYFDQHAVYTRRFGITAVPSVVSQQNEEMVLTVEERLVS